MPDNNLTKLYNAVSDQFDIGTFDAYSARMKTPEDRKKFYDAVSAQGFDLGDYNTYEKRLTSDLTPPKKKDDVDGSQELFSDSLKLGEDISSYEKDRDLDTFAKHYPQFTQLVDDVKKNPDDVRKAFELQRAQEQLQFTKDDKYAGFETDLRLKPEIDAANRLLGDTQQLQKVAEELKTQGTFENLGQGTKEGLKEYIKGYTDFWKQADVRRITDRINTKLKRAHDTGLADPLTKEEKFVLRALQNNAEVHKALDDKLPGAYTWGQGIGQSLGFMAEFALTGGIGAGVAKNIAAKGVTKAGKFISGATAKLAQAGIQTAAMPTFYRDWAKNSASGQGGFEAFGNAYYDTFKENIAERIFTGKMANVGKNKAAAKFLARTGLATTGAKNARGVVKGIVEEYAEEKISEALGAIKDAPDFKTFYDQFTDPKQNLNTFMTTFIMAGTMGGGQLAAKEYYRQKTNMKIAVLSKAIPEGVRSEIDGILTNEELSVEEASQLIGETIKDAVDSGLVKPEEANKTLVYGHSYAGYKMSQQTSDKIDEDDEVRQEAKEKPVQEGEEVEEVKPTPFQEIIDEEQAKEDAEKAEEDKKKAETKEALDKELAQLDEEFKSKETGMTKAQYREAKKKIEKKYKEPKPVNNAKEIRETAEEAVQEEKDVEETVRQVRVRDTQEDGVDPKEELKQQLQRRAQELNDLFKNKSQEKPEQQALNEAVSETMTNTQTFAEFTEEQKEEFKENLEESPKKAYKYFAETAESNTTEQVLTYEDSKADILEKARKARSLLARGKREASESVNAVKESIENFVKANKLDFTPDQYKTIIGRLRKGVKSKKSLDKLLEYVDEVGKKIEVREAKRLRDNINKRINKITLPETKVNAKKFSKMSQSEADAKIKGIDAEIGELNQLYESTEDEKLFDKIQKLEEDQLLISALYDLENRDYKELRKSELFLHEIAKSRSAEVRAHKKAQQAATKARAAEFEKANRGKFDLNKERAEQDINKSTARVVAEGIGDTMIRLRKSFLNSEQAMGFLINRLNRSWELGRVDGKSKWNPKNWIGTKLIDGIREGQSRKIKIRNQLITTYESEIKKRFGTIAKANKAANREIKLTVDMVKPVTGQETQYEQTKVPINMGTAAHIWYSYNSVSNSEYMKRLCLGTNNTIYRLSPQQFITLDRIMKSKENEQLREFTEWMADEFYPATRQYLEPTHKELTGMDLLQLEDYLPVNGVQTGEENFSTRNFDYIGFQQSMVKTRIGGYYNMERNNIFHDAYDYINNTANYAGLAKPTSDLVGVLRNKAVNETLSARDLQDTKNAILDIISHEFNPNQNNDKLLAKLYRNFITSKVAVHVGLIPKQMVSTLTVFDPDYVSTRELGKAIPKIFSKDARSKVKEILMESYDFQTRSITDMEGMVKEGSSRGWNLDLAKRMNQAMESATANLSPEKAKAARALMEYTFMPTKYGDRIAIKSAGSPLIYAAYNERLNQLKKQGITGTAADGAAKKHALSIFEKWMNQTQQSSQFTDRARFQGSGWRYFMPFSNSTRLYADKLLGAYGDLYRGFKGNIDYGKTGYEKYKGAIPGSLKTKAMQKIMLYQFVLPIFFQQMGKGFIDLTGLFDDDEEKRGKAVQELTKEGLTDWTSGLVGISYLTEFAVGLSEGKPISWLKNTTPFADDIFGLVEASIKYFKGKDMDKLGFFGRKKERKKRDKAFYDMVTKGLNSVGLPGEVVRRFRSAMTEYEKDELTKKVLRSAGFSKQQLDVMFGKTRK